MTAVRDVDETKRGRKTAIVCSNRVRRDVLGLVPSVRGGHGEFASRRTSATATGTSTTPTPRPGSWCELLPGRDAAADVYAPTSDGYERTITERLRHWAQLRDSDRPLESDTE